MVWFITKSSHTFPKLVDMARLRSGHFWSHSSKDAWNVFSSPCPFTALTKVAKNDDSH